MNRFRYLLLTTLVLLVAAVPARAQVNDYAWAWLEVCDKGTVPVEVVVAAKNQDLLRGYDKYYWAITGTTVPPGKCKNVYAHSAAPAAYLAFGFYDTGGQWGSGKIAQVPNFGVHTVLFREYPVLTSASKGVCARLDETEYRTDDDPQIDCASIRLTGGGREVGHGAFFALTSALYFEPDGQKCVVAGSQTNCYGGDYHLNISPSGSDRDLHAVRGTSSGKDVAESPEDSGNAATIRFLQALAKAALEEHENEAKAAADAAEAHRQYLMEQPAAREKQQKQILAAAAAGDPDAKVPAQMIEREAENNRRRWETGTRQSPAAFDPQWTGHNVAIIGTVSRVEIDPSGSPQWVSIYFKESPDATFVVCSPYQDLFQERIGMNLSVLVGKTMEAAGQIESPHCGQKTSRGSIRVVESTQWQIH